MTFMADENFPRPALTALRNTGWEVFSVAEKCPGISDEEVAALCAERQQVLLTFDKDFGELVFHRGLSAGSGVVLFRFIPESPEEVADAAVALLQSQPDLRGTFCVITRERIRVRPMRPAPPR
jgi:predicted nuclease of predicted toxin-antitoxin system